MDVRTLAPLLLNQLLLRQLADAGAWQRGADFHRGRHLMTTDLVGKEINTVPKVKMGVSGATSAAIRMDFMLISAPY